MMTFIDVLIEFTIIFREIVLPVDSYVLVRFVNLPYLPTCGGVVGGSSNKTSPTYYSAFPHQLQIITPPFVRIAQ